MRSDLLEMASMNKVYQIFVSSTYADLADERRRVSETLAKAGYIPSGMELFPATDQQQLEFIKRVIDRCDYYVVIVGGRYGSLADDNISFTEMEYEYAVQSKIPVLAFLHANPDKIEAGKTDRDANLQKRLAGFRERLGKGRIVDFWNEPQELCTKVVIAIAQAVNLSPGVGWVRGDQAIDPKILQAKDTADGMVAQAKERTAKLEHEAAVLRNKILELEKAFSPRVLEQGLTAQALSKFAGVPFAVVSPSDFEPKRTAGQIRFLLDAAHWLRFTEALRQPFFAYPDGVTVHIMGTVSKSNDPASRAAEALVSVLKQNQIEARVGSPLARIDEDGRPVLFIPPTSSAPPNVVVVEVGPKPLPPTLQLSPDIPADERGNKVWGNIAE
jgi:hypothetical protein